MKTLIRILIGNFEKTEHNMKAIDDRAVCGCLKPDADAL